MPGNMPGSHGSIPNNMPGGSHGNHGNHGNHASMPNMGAASALNGFGGMASNSGNMPQQPPTSQQSGPSPATNMQPGNHGNMAGNHGNGSYDMFGPIGARGGPSVGPTPGQGGGGPDNLNLDFLDGDSVDIQELLQHLNI